LKKQVEIKAMDQAVSQNEMLVLVARFIG